MSILFYSDSFDSRSTIDSLEAQIICYIHIRTYVLI